LYEGFTEALPADFQMAHVQRLDEALEWLWQEKCDVMLLDLGLPDSHGLDTLVLARAHSPDVPIVVLTGFQNDAMGVEAVQQGAQDYLVKGQIDTRLVARSMRYAIERRRAEAALTRQAVTLAMAEDLQRSRQRLITAQEGVRRDIAVRLDDGVKRKLLALKARLQEVLSGSNPPEKGTGVLKEVMDGLDQVIHEGLDLLSWHLYPSALSLGLVPAFWSLVDQFKGDLAVAMLLDEGLVRQEESNPNLLPELVKLAIYRIAEEALANVSQHAQATRLSIGLALLPDGWLRLTVRDDGRGFDLAGASGGRGMAFMVDYAEAAGGTCKVQTAPGAGAEISATLPLAGPGAAHNGGSPS
jgi:signal transduction histidine kinase